MKPIKKCNLCGRTRFKKVLTGRDNMYNLPGTFTLVRCRNCDLRFLNPQPGAKKLSLHYPTTYYSVADQVKRAPFSELLYTTYFSEKGNLFLKALFFPIYPLLRGTKVEKDASILDVGCGTGTFLARMKALGMTVAGVDPHIANDIPSLNIKKGDVTSLGNKHYDVITLNHVLEHVPNPNAQITHIKQLLKKNCTAIISVPNIDSILFKIFGKNWAELDLPRHLHHFNKKTLSAYFAKHGLAITKTRHNCVPFEFTGSIFYWLNSLRKNKKTLQESTLANNRFLNALFLPLCHLLNLLRLGGRIEMHLTR